MTFTARVEKRIVHYTPTDALTDGEWTTYTYQPTGDDPPSVTLPRQGTEVEIVANDRGFTPGTRQLVSIADARSGHRYGTVPANTLFVHHRKGCIR